jgi:Skp family chaperone for outer membrane proteins
VKKTVLAAAGFIVLGGLCYVGHLYAQQQPQASAQQPYGKAAAPPMRIALLNLTYVIKKYGKYVNFQNEIKGTVEPFQKKDAELRHQLEELQKQASDPARAAQPGQREELERKAKDIQRRMEDNSAEAKLLLGKRSDDEMRILFMDVYEAAQRYAASHDLDLVLHYNDAVTKEDFLSAQNIARKLNTGALMPLYFAPSMDISMQVADLLNSNMGSSAIPAGAAPQGGATPAGGLPR